MQSRKISQYFIFENKVLSILVLLSVVQSCFPFWNINKRVSFTSLWYRIENNEVDHTTSLERKQLWSQSGFSYFRSWLHKNHNGHIALQSHEGLPVLIGTIYIFRYFSEKEYTINRKQTRMYIRSNWIFEAYFSKRALKKERKRRKRTAGVNIKVNASIVKNN